MPTPPFRTFRRVKTKKRKNQAMGLITSPGTDPTSHAN